MAEVQILLDRVKILRSSDIISTHAEYELEQLENDLDLMEAFLEAEPDIPKKLVSFDMLVEQIRMGLYEAKITYLYPPPLKEVIFSKIFSRGKYIMRFSTRIEEEVKLLTKFKVKPLLDQARVQFPNLVLVDGSNTQEEKIWDRTKERAGGSVPELRMGTALGAASFLPQNSFMGSLVSFHIQDMALRQDNVVGFEDQTEILINYLTEESDELDVISIIGMPGIGKTTVAWKIYCDPRIQYEFPTLIWIYFSQEFNMTNVLLTILKRFTQQDMSRKSLEDLTQSVRENLKRGKFLIFMDDVWTVEAWDQIQSVLPKHNKMGKVLITSRNEQVANHIRKTHQLRFLDENESWELLQLKVFGKLGDFPSELEELGKSIAKKCHGLPLAIIVIGGILVGKFSTTRGFMDMKREWENVIKDVETYRIHDANKEKLMEHIISLSYYSNMPHDLRDCFLYLGMFPKDTEIIAWKLTNLWIAEGFIRQKPGKSMEKIAQDNLKELIKRNLVMIDKTKSDGTEVKTCRVHSKIHEFCQKVARRDHHNLFKEIRMYDDDESLNGIQRYRRICIHSHVEEFLLEKTKIPNARSFLCFSKSPIHLENKDITSIIDAFELLRVLDANAIKFPKFPTELTNLMYLKYLTLSGDKFKILPKAISRLRILQTLIVDTPTHTLKIKANIWKMKALRHIKTKSSIILNKDVKGQGGGNLQTLTRLSPKSCTENVFTKAKYLKKLGIRGGLDNLDPKFLEKLDHLEKLKLVNDVFPKVASEYPLRYLPQKFPPKLIILTLSATYLDWTHMSTLGNLGTLEVLKLKDNAFVGNRWNAVGGGFYCLQLLYIENADLKLWTTSNDPFPQLRSLVIKNCKKLQGVPFDLRKNLEILSLECVTKYAVSSAKKIKKDKQQAKGYQKSQTGGFKLIIAPGDE